MITQPLRVLWLLLISIATFGAGGSEFKLPASLIVADMAIDQAGNIYVCGGTSDQATLGTNVIGLGRRQPGFKPVVLKLAPAGGQIVAGVILHSHLAASLQKIAVTDSGRVVVAGTSPFLQGEVRTNALVVLQFDSELRRLLQSTFLPARFAPWIGTRAMCTDGQGNVFVGGSISGRFADSTLIGPPVVSLYSSAFVAGIDADGSVRFLTTFGGTTGAGVEALAVTRGGELYAAGATSSDDFPGADGVAPPPRKGAGLDGFLVRFAPDGKTFTRSLLLGGEGDDLINALATDSLGRIYAGGSTSCRGWIPIEPNMTTQESSYSGFVLQVDETGTDVVSLRAIQVSGNDAITSMRIDENGLVESGGVSGIEVRRAFATYGGLGIEPDDALASGSFVAQETTGGGLKVAWLGANSSHLVDVRFGRMGKVHVLVRDPWWKKAKIAVSDVDRTVENASDLRVMVQISRLETAGHTNNVIRLRAHIYSDSTPEMVSLVKFHEGGRLIGTVTNPPYEITFNDRNRRIRSFWASAVVAGKELRSYRVPLRNSRKPRNDNFANRREIRRGRSVVRGSMSGATVEPFVAVYPYGSETGTHYFAPQPDVWWTWTAPKDGVFEIAVSGGGSGSALVNVFKGISLTNLQMASAAFSGPSAILRATAGDAYLVRIATFAEPGEVYKLRIHPVTEPKNDDFTNATAVSGAPIEIVTAPGYASIEPGEANWFGGTVWYVWTAEKTGSYISMGGGVSLYKGDSIENLVSHGNRLTWSLLVGMAFEAEQGERIHLAVPIAAARSNSVVRISELSAPANDHFSNASPLNGLATTIGTTLGANVEFGEPMTAAGATVWWQWRAPESGMFSIELNPTDSVDNVPPLHVAPTSEWPSGGSVLVIFSGSELQTLTKMASSSVATPAEVHFRAEAGQLYFVRVAYRGLESFQLSLAMNEVPANDAFIDAVMLASETAVRGTTRAASTEPSEPLHGGNFFPANGSVWYDWIAPSDGAFVLELLGSSAMDIYKGETLDTLHSLANGVASHEFLAEGGVHYRIAVYQPPGFYGWLYLHEFTLRARRLTPP